MTRHTAFNKKCFALCLVLILVGSHRDAFSVENKLFSYAKKRWPSAKGYVKVLGGSASIVVHWYGLLLSGAFVGLDNFEDQTFFQTTKLFLESTVLPDPQGDVTWIDRTTNTAWAVLPTAASVHLIQSGIADIRAQGHFRKISLKKLFKQ